jgi:erythrin-vacuolar iron transport family protein
MRNFDELSEREILALAIASEEEDGRIYSDIAEGLRADYPGSAKVFIEMAAEESEHRRRLIDLYREKFGEHIPLIRRQDVRGFLSRKPVWQLHPMKLDVVRKLAEQMEMETASFYRRAASRSTDASIRKLLGDLAEAEDAHEHIAERLVAENLTSGVREHEDETAKRMLVLQVIQPGLAGLMDGSVSTLAPVFAAAFATGHSWEAFLVGMAASIGAGISMAFAEALSDDGSLTGRGSPWLRGAVCGIMTAIGGLGHSLPYLVPDSLPNAFWIATAIAGVVVFFELWAIAFIRSRYMDTPFLQAVFQIVLGGVIVLAVGILIGGA